MIYCNRDDCAYYNVEGFEDKCKECTENPNADIEIAIFHFEDKVENELYE